MDELLGEFLAETEESLDRLDTALLRFEREPSNRDVLNNIFRLFHTIKGTCGFLGLDRLARLAHAAESLMGRYRDGAIVTVDGVSVILASLDRIKQILHALEEHGREPSGDDDDLIAGLDRLSESKAETPGTFPEMPMEGAACGEVPGQAPSPHADFEEAADAAWRVADAKRAALQVRQANGAPTVDERAIDSVRNAPALMSDAGGGRNDVPDMQDCAALPTAGADETPAADPERDHLAHTVRVKVALLERLMTTVSELVLMRNQLMDMVRRHSDSPFKGPLHRLSTITGELQRGVMAARMLPISKAWQKLPRLVRDLSVELDKPLRLVTAGGEVELDRQVLELIRDPITHLVRNAADHGIESRAVRRAAGKPETGTIRLTAYSEGGHIVIDIADDGRGLDLETIKAKCAANGLASQAALDRMGVAELQQYLFRPGFSTASQVTAISGRGVGLDVVRDNVELIGGSVKVRSGDSGTVFTLRIPLSLSIAPGLIVRSGGVLFAVPQHNVREVVRAKAGSEARIEMIRDAAQLRLRGRFLPVFDLAGLLKLSDGAQTDERLKREAPSVVIMEIGARVFGIVVDDVLRAEEIVVKPKARLLCDLAVFSGNTILGDGSVIMIIDPNALATLAGVHEVPVETQEVAPEQTPVEACPLTSLLLFRAGDAGLKAVPVELVTRLEEIDAAEIEHVEGGDVVKYRGGLMPILFAPGAERRREGLQPVLVFAGDGRVVGLAVDEIVDIVEEAIDVDMRSEAPGLIGTMVMHDQVVSLVDVSHFVGQGLVQKTAAEPGGWKSGGKLLLVDDSAFFRNMLAPLLSASGYEVTLAASAHEALELKEEGTLFDVIVSDLEMPNMDGIAFAEQIKADSRWGDTPMIALTSHANPKLQARSRAAGFVDFVGKFDRKRLMEALEGQAAHWGEAA